MRIIVQGRYDLAAIWAACDELDLWPSFVEMLAAYEEANRSITNKGEAS